MKIQLERSGGFTGMRLKVAIDTDQLDPQEKSALEALAESALGSGSPEKNASPGPGADRFSYRITIEKQGAPQTIEIGEAGLSENLRAFVQRVILLGRAASK
jgi:hypothetical protein